MMIVGGGVSRYMKQAIHYFFSYSSVVSYCYMCVRCGVNSDMAIARVHGC